MSDEQERLRVEGLRALTRIIARHVLADACDPARTGSWTRTEGTRSESVRHDRSA